MFKYNNYLVTHPGREMTTLLIDAFSKQVALAVSDQNKLNACVRSIQKYIDTHHSVLFDSGPAKRLMFCESDKEVIYNFTEILPERVKAVLAKTGFQKSWMLLNDPFVILSIMCIRELTLKNKPKEAELFVCYLSCKFYSSRQRSSFPHLPNEAIMAYTINNLSNKFKYKALQSNFAVIKDTSMISHTTYTPNLNKLSEEDLMIYVPQMENRIAKVISAVANEFYENHKNKNYLNTSKSFDDENKMIDNENTSEKINGLADSVTHAFFTRSPNMNLCKIVADRCGLSYSVIYNVMLEIKGKEDPENFKKLTLALFDTLSTDNPGIFDSVCSREFSISAISRFSISNTVDPHLIFLKQEADRYMETYCSKYSETQRSATKTSYRTAFISYIVYFTVLQKCS